MTSIRKQRRIAVSADAAWDALRDWSHVHERLVPGFLTELRMDGEDRIVSFFNGNTVRERLVACSESQRRLVWTLVEGRFAHYNGAAEVVDLGDGTIRFVWTVDLLPDALASIVDQLVERGIDRVKQTLEQS